MLQPGLKDTIAASALPIGAATSTNQEEQILAFSTFSTEQYNQTDILNQIASAVQAVAAAKGILSDLRVTVLGGAIVISSGTITTVATVTTVGTVTGITNIGGIPAVQLIPSNQNIVSVLSNVNNVTV